jgi:hypothetical protein
VRFRSLFVSVCNWYAAACPAWLHLALSYWHRILHKYMVALASHDADRYEEKLLNSHTSLGYLKFFGIWVYFIKKMKKASAATNNIWLAYYIRDASWTQPKCQNHDNLNQNLKHDMMTACNTTFLQKINLLLRPSSMFDKNIHD